MPTLIIEKRSDPIQNFGSDYFIMFIQHQSFNQWQKFRYKKYFFMKKNFTLLFSLIALVASGQTGAMDLSRLNSMRFNRTPTVGMNASAPTPSSATLAHGLSSALGNTPFSQISASHLTSNSSAEAVNAQDTNNTGQNHVLVSNAADIASKGLANLTNAQGVTTSSIESGSNSGAINLLNNTASAIGSYVNTGNLDITKGVSAQILGDTTPTIGRAVTTGITQGHQSSAQNNISTVANSRLSALVQPAIALKDAISATQTTRTTTDPNYSFSHYHPKVVSEVVNAIPLNAINMAMHESSSYNKGMNSGTTNGLASAMASADNKHTLSTLSNSGAIGIGNALAHSTGGVRGGDVIGGIGNYASNALHTINSNG